MNLDVLLLAQADAVSGVADVATRAGVESGWVAMFLVVIVLGALALFGLFLRGDKADARETQRFIRTEMAEVIDGNTIVIGRLIGAMRDRPCLHDSDLTKLEARVVDQAELQTLDEATQRAVARVKRRERRRERPDGEDTPA